MNGQFSVKLLQKLNTYGQKTVNVKLIYWVKGQGTIDINLKQYHMTEGYCTFNAERFISNSKR